MNKVNSWLCISHPKLIFVAFIVFCFGSMVLVLICYYVCFLCALFALSHFVSMRLYKSLFSLDLCAWISVRNEINKIFDLSFSSHGFAFKLLVVSYCNWLLMLFFMISTEIHMKLEFLDDFFLIQESLVKLSRKMLKRNSLPIWSGRKETRVTGWLHRGIESHSSTKWIQTHYWEVAYAGDFLEVVEFFFHFLLFY